MTFKSIVPRALASADAQGAIDHYIDEAGPDVALGFIDALQRAYDAIGEAPATGSPRWAICPRRWLPTRLRRMANWFVRGSSMSIRTPMPIC